RGESFRQIRLFPNWKNISFQGRIHETLGPSISDAGISIRHSAVRIIHTGYNTEVARKAKSLRNHELLKIEVAEYPDSPAVNMEMGNSYHQLGMYNEAIQHYNKVRTIPNSEHLQRDIYRSIPSLIGATLLAKGDIEGAEAAFRESIDNFPEKPSPYFHMAEIAMKRNDIATLLAMSSRLITLREEVSTVASDFNGMVAHAYAWSGTISLIRGDAETAANLFAESESRKLPPAFKYETALEAAKKAGMNDLSDYFERKLIDEGKRR
ncbi:MAG: hypothetical protein JNL74_18570, partial [Fibrobacteres bacterium]|nr:hypothetical protein [Fibrobacterota bacterium]